MSENTNKNTDIISRRSAREQAFILLFEMCFCQDDFSIDLVKENALDSRDVEFCDYAEKVALGVNEHKDELDEIIDAHLKKGWKINRLSKVTLAVLRLAIYEMKYEEDVPFSVSINEAVELSKKFSIDESGFVNGVLGAISKDLENK
jgi:N utilization substance protein B